MKQFYFKSFFLSLLMMVIGINVANADDTWVKTDPSDLATGDVVAIVDLTTGKAMSNNGGADSAPTAMAVTLSSDKSEITSAVAETLQWEVTIDNGSYMFGVTSETTTNYLYCNNSNNGVRVGTNSNNKFTFENDAASTQNSTDKYLKNEATSRFVGVYNSSDWRCYSSVNTNIKNTKTAFFKKVTTVSDKVLVGIMLSGYRSEFNVGDEFTFGEEGTVTALYDDNSTMVVTNKATFSGYDMNTAGTYEVTVSYKEGGITKTATYNITVNALSGDAYTLVTNANDLEEGDNVIIVNKANSKAMGGQNSNNRAATDVTFDADDNAIVTSNSSIQVFTLEGNANNGWYFYTGEGYIYAASNSSNHLKTETEKDANDNAKASISISGDEATVKFQGNNSRNIIRYNSGNNIFSCYESGQLAIQLYKKPGSTAALTEIALGGDYPTTFKIGDEFSHEGMTVIATFDDGTTKDVTSGAVFSEPDMSTAGTKTVTVSYTKGSVTKTATYDITVSAVQLTEITLSGDYPTTFNVGDEFSHEGMTVTASYDDSTTEDVTADATFEGYDMNTAGTQTVTVSYTKGEVTKTATYDITVSTVAVTGITLNVIEETLYVGQKLKITATIEPENATNKKLIWTSEDESVATVDENGEVTAVGVGTIIIKASAEDDNDIFGACTINVEELTGDAYTLVTSVDDLKAGNTVIIVNKEYEKAMSTTQNNNNRGAATVPFNTEDQAVVPTTSGIQVFTLEGDAEGWYFKTDEGYIYAASSSANQLKTETEKDDNAKAEITISGDETTVKFKGSNTRNLLRYNSGSDLFSCYASGQQAIQLYMREAEVTPYSLVVGEEETPFEELTLTKELPAWTDFYIKDSKGKKYYAEDGTHYVIVAENHENLNTSENDEYMFSFRKANTWVFTITEPTDAEGLKLTVNPETPAGTKYMMADDFDPSGTFQETEDVFDADGKLTKEMTTATFCIVKGDDYIYYSLGAAESNAEDGNGLSVWEFSGEDNTVGFSEGDLSIKYRVSEADTYNFTLDLENNTITALPSVRKYTLVAGGDEIAFDSELKITGKELPASTEFYIKDNYGKTYYAEHGKNIISAENHENLSTYYPVEDDTPADNPEKFYFMKANTWNFTLTEPTEEGATIKLTITPQTAGETKYMLSGYLQESEDVFDENLKLTKEMTTQEFYFTRSDDYGLTNLTPATFNAPEDRRYWIFSEDAPTVEFIVGEIRGSYTVGEAGTYTFTLNLENNTITAEAVPTTYTLVVGETEYPFDGLTLTQELPAQTKFYIKDNKGHVYYSADAQSEVIIIAENHENLPTSAEGKDFYLSKANTWVFTLTEASDGLMLTVSPETAGETKYMLSAYLQESDDVFDENLKLTKEMTSTTEQFYFTRSDDYGLTNLTPSTFNAPEDRRYWIFSEDAPTVEYIAGEILGSYTVGEAGTYTFTLDLENKTITAEAVPITYSLMANEGDHWAEYEFDGLILNEEFPNGTQFYIKDSKGNIYYGQYNNSVIYAENHENLSTYYPIEDSGVTEKPETFKLKKNAVWHFTITEPTEDGETIKLTVVPSTIEDETIYMLSSEYLGGTDEVFDETFDENGKVTKQLAAKEAFYISREDGFGLFNLTAAETNDPDGYYVWEFSEDAPTVGYIPAKIINAFRVKDADLYTITLDTENKTVTVEAVQTTYTLVAAGDALNEYPFDGLTLTQELPAQTKFYVKDNKGNVYHSADAQSEVIIIAENHENLPTAAEGKDFYLSKANTWVFTLTEVSDGLMLTVSPETAGETKYMLSAYLQESDDVFDENLQLTKEMTSTTEQFYFTRSDDYGLTNLTPATFNAPEDRRYWIFSEDAPTVEYIAGKILGSYTVGETGTYTFTLDLENKTVTAEKYVETADVPITSAEWATFVAPKPVMFPDDVTAYIVSRVEGNVAVGIQVTEVPAGTAVIVNGTEGTHKAVVVEEGVLPAENMLQASDGTVTGDGTIWVLAVQDGEAGFARLATGKKLSEGKAYLQVEAAGAKLQFVVDGEGTGIHGVNVDFSDGDWYNLQGVKVSTPQKGIYIHNGKKVVIK